MTDNEIIKVKELIKKLEEAYDNYYNSSKGMPYDMDTTLLDSAICFENFLNEINRLQAENKAFAEIIKKQDDEIINLRKELLSRKNLEESFSKSVKQFDKKLARTVELTKSEAYREFAERLKQVLYNDEYMLIRSIIDNLLKELVGEDNGR